MPTNNDPKKVLNALLEQLSLLKIEAAEAAMVARKASKAEAVDAARTAAELKERVASVTRQVKDAEKAVAQSEKDAKAKAKADAAAERKAWVMQRLQDAQEDPFLAFTVDYPALGRWAAEVFQDEVCYVEGAGWGEWTGTHWDFSKKPSANLMDRVREEYCRKEGDIVAKLNANARAAEYILDHAKGALTLSRTLFNRPEVAHLVAFQNFTVDLKTGATMLHNPKHYMTGAIQCDFSQKADLDRVLTAFARFWPSDPETAEMFQTVIGYAMTAETSAKRMIFLVGNQDDPMANGDNGKSLVQAALVKLFGMGKGGWGTTVKGSVIVDTGDRDANSHDGAKTPLIWRRLAIATEFRRGASADAGEFNRFCGGDIQQARPPHGEHPVEFTNFATGIFSMNQVLRFKTWDKATMVRLTPFEFRETFHDPGTAPAGGQEKELGLKNWLLSDEGQKALALYAVRGAMHFYALNGGEAGNIPESEAVTACKMRILASSNPYSEFFSEYLVFDENCDTLTSALSVVFDEYLGHRSKLYERDLLKDVMGPYRVSKVKVKGIEYWRGVGLTEKGLRVAKMRGKAVPVYTRWSDVVRPIVVGA